MVTAPAPITTSNVPVELIAAAPAMAIKMPNTPPTLCEFAVRVEQRNYRFILTHLFRIFCKLLFDDYSVLSFNGLSTSFEQLLLTRDKVTTPLTKKLRSLSVSTSRGLLTDLLH